MGLPMTLADDPARLRILTDLDATLLVEAAAGTGKTALMAGRLTMLLARGTEPGAIAAITFTELAASGLATRVQRYVEELLAGAALAPELAEQAEHVAMNAVTPISDIHGSTEFRRRLVGNLVRRAVMDLQNGVAR